MWGLLSLRSRMWSSRMFWYPAQGRASGFKKWSRRFCPENPDSRNDDRILEQSCSKLRDKSIFPYKDYPHICRLHFLNPLVQPPTPQITLILRQSLISVISLFIEKWLKLKTASPIETWVSQNRNVFQWSQGRMAASRKKREQRRASLLLLCAVVKR